MAESNRLAFLALLALAACQRPPPPEPPPAPPPAAVPEVPVGENWRAVIRSEDLDRIERLDAAWAEGLAEARPRFASRIDAEGPLLEPWAGLPRASLPPGPYRCRLIRLGSGPEPRAFTAYPSYFCHVGVEDELLSLTKQTGSERPGGYLWTDDDRRLIFLGAMASGDDETPPAYGESSSSDLAGVAERVEDYRYRIVFPWPPGGAKIDILELVPYVPVHN